MVFFGFTAICEFCEWCVCVQDGGTLHTHKPKPLLSPAVYSCFGDCIRLDAGLAPLISLSDFVW